MVWIRESNSCIKNKGQHFSAFFLILSGRKIVQQGKKNRTSPESFSYCIVVIQLACERQIPRAPQTTKEKKLTIPFKKIKLKTEKGKA